MEFIFEVRDHLEITDRGCIIMPGIPEGFQNVRVKDHICLVKPNGDKADTYIEGIELISYREVPKTFNSPILLPAEFAKADVPLGTKVYLK